MYYFFSASLPELKPGEVPPLSVEEFDSDAKLQLSEHHYKLLTSSAEGEEAEVYRKMRLFEEYLRNRIAAKRAEKMNLPLDLPEPEAFFSEVDAAMPVLSALPPAERERGVDALRWDILNEITQNHDFDFDHICAYRAKLLLAEKYRSRNAGTGKQNFDAVLRETANKEG